MGRGDLGKLSPSSQRASGRKTFLRHLHSHLDVCSGRCIHSSDSFRSGWIQDNRQAYVHYLYNWLLMDIQTTFVSIIWLCLPLRELCLLLSLPGSKMAASSPKSQPQPPDERACWSNFSSQFKRRRIRLGSWLLRICPGLRAEVGQRHGG